MQTIKKLYILLPVLFLPVVAFAQFNVNYHALPGSDAGIVKDIYKEYKKNPAKDSVDLFRALRESAVLFYNEGYLASSADSIVWSGKNADVLWNTGSQYKLVKLATSVEDEPLLSEAGVRDRLYNNKPFSPERFTKLNSRILNWCSENGYPFALVKLDSIDIDTSSINAKLVIDKGPLIIMDTAVIRGTAKLSRVYLLNYLSLRPGQPYNDRLIRKISSRLRELPFVSEARPFEIEFHSEYARPVFYLQHKRASQFNGIIGLLPDEANPGKAHITGDVRLRLHNAFGRAELFDLNWTNPQPRTQDLKIKFQYPFIFNFPVGADLDLSIYKKDTLYLEFNRQAGLRYYFRGNSSFRAFAGIRSSGLISVKGYTNITTLPPYADVSVTNYGTGVFIEKLDYRLNPRKGFVADLAASTGVRTISKNSRINAEVYDSLDLKTTQYRLEFTADGYLPLAERLVLNIGTIAGLLESPALFQNELFRFGGLKTLRGFDESSLLASTYVIGKAETRFLLEQNSYLFLFYNQAYFEDKSRNSLISDDPYGFGAGLTFETRLGIFSFNYALGSQADNPIVFRSAKIHFGLINYF